MFISLALLTDLSIIEIDNAQIALSHEVANQVDKVEEKQSISAESIAETEAEPLLTRDSTTVLWARDTFNRHRRRD